MKAWLLANLNTKEGFIRHKQHKQFLVGNKKGNLRRFPIDLNLNRIKSSNYCLSFQVLCSVLFYELGTTQMVLYWT